jgi:hypothetical protein
LDLQIEELKKAKSEGKSELDLDAIMLSYLSKHKKVTSRKQIIMRQLTKKVEKCLDYET